MLINNHNSFFNDTPDLVGIRGFSWNLKRLEGLGDVLPHNYKCNLLEIFLGTRRESSIFFMLSTYHMGGSKLSNKRNHVDGFFSVYPVLGSNVVNVANKIVSKIPVKRKWEFRIDMTSIRLFECFLDNVCKYILNDYQEVDISKGIDFVDWEDLINGNMNLDFRSVNFLKETFRLQE